MNEKMIFEIGNIIHVRRGKWFKLLEPEEIINSYEYNQFKKKCPIICEIAEK